MGLDAVCLRAVINEIKPKVERNRIEKIQQPSKDQVIFLLRGGKRLLINAGASQPRMHLTSLLRDNPAQPPMFCMLLRKYISGGFIVSVEQEPLERVITMTIEAMDEMGEMSQFRLIHECMGRHSNLVLCNKEGMIIDCLKRVDFEMSQGHQVLPGLMYHLPEKQVKLDPLEITEEEFASQYNLCMNDSPLDDWLIHTFNAISPLMAREIVYRAYGETDHRKNEGPEKLLSSYFVWQSAVKDNNFTPTVVTVNKKPKEYSCIDILQYESLGTVSSFETFSEMLDSFYETKEQAERVKQKGQDLLKTASNARDRVRRKLALQEKEYLQTKDRDTLRLNGELITANLYRMKRGEKTLVAQNYYDENLGEVTISLDPRLSPQENSARYFKLYNKAKTAEKMLSRFIQEGKVELEYLESVLQEISVAESEMDFNDIRMEMSKGGYMKHSSLKNKGMQKSFKPREFVSSGGLRILVGRSNTQNDQLTFKDAHKWDIWLHTQKIHGSHVILFTEGQEPSEQDIFEAATLAAYYSQGKESSKVMVDYTPARYLRKPNGAKPGMVIYTEYESILVSPDESMVNQLKKT